MRKLLGVLLLLLSLAAYGQNPVTAKEGSFNGYALRITYDNAPPTTYVDYTIDSDGVMTVSGTGGDPSVIFDFDSVSFTGTGGILLHRGTTAQRLTGNGILRYNTTTDKFEGYEDGEWKDIVTGASGASIGEDEITFGDASGNIISSSDLTFDGTDVVIDGSDVVVEGDIGTTVQAFDPGLQSISGLTTSADQMIYTTGSDTYATTSLTSYARTILDDANESAFKSTTNLETGVDVQAWDAGLDDISGLAVTDDNFIVGDGANWVAESGSTARTSLGLGTIATQDANNVSISGGTITGITDLVVPDGGIGVSSLTAYAPIFGGTTSTGAVQSGTVGTAGQVLTSNGAGALPTFQNGGTIVGSTGSTDNALLRANGTSGSTLQNSGLSISDLSNNVIDIHSQTSDGSDNRGITINSGSSPNYQRGAYIAMFGNEFATTDGNLTLAAGEGVNALVQISSNGTLGIQVDSDANVSIPNGNLTVSGNVDIDGGTIDGTTIGGSTPAAGTFTQATVDNLVINNNTLTNSSGDITLTPNASNHVNISAGGLEIAGTEAISSGRAGSFTTITGTSSLIVTRTTDATDGITLRQSEGSGRWFGFSSTDAGDLRIFDRGVGGAGGNGLVLTVGNNGSITASGNVTAANIAGSTFSPTLTGDTNVDAVVNTKSWYSRVGTVVTATYIVSVDPTASLSQTIFFASLPVASNFTQTYDIAQIDLSFTATVTADTANDRLQIEYSSSGTTAEEVRFSCTYVIQ